MNNKQSVEVMVNILNKIKVLNNQQIGPYGDLTIEKEGYNKITHLVKEHKLFNTPDYKDFVDPTLYKEASTHWHMH